MLNNEKFTVWFTGLPAAGKTTLAYATQRKLSEIGVVSVVLDGDEMRAGVCRDLAFSHQERIENIRRIAELAKILNKQGIIVLVALVSPIKEGRESARHCIGQNNFFEVYLNTPLEICQRRDPKKLYARALVDNSLGLTGVQTPYETPENPDLVLSSEVNSPECNVNLVFNLISKKA